MIALALQQRTERHEPQLPKLYRARARVALAKARIAFERGAVGLARLHLHDARRWRCEAHMVERRSVTRAV